jgi:hypothetical protein
MHPGIVNFLLGDGSVRAISVATPTGSLLPGNANEHNPDSILARLGNVNDGNPVVLP